MGIHSGHRDRMKKKFMEQGADGFNDHQLLELLLFYCIPQGDVNPLAHELMLHFGSFFAVFDADFDELLKVKGIGTHAAVLFRLLPQIMRRYELSRMDCETIITSSTEAGTYFLPYFYGARNEMSYLLCLDAKGKVLGCDRLSEGSLNMTVVDNRSAVECALRHRASCVFLAHNHTSGLAKPSAEDVSATVQLYQLMDAMGIELIDHLVVVDEDFVSLKDSGARPWGNRVAFDYL